jgi:hypothetical protein
MFEDEQRLRLLTAAAKLQDIIATLDIDLELRAMIDFYGSGTNTHRGEVQTLEDANAKLQVAGEVTLQSQLDDSGDPFTALNQAIYDVSKFVVQINNSQLTGSMHLVDGSKTCDSESVAGRPAGSPGRHRELLQVVVS